MISAANSRDRVLAKLHSLAGDMADKTQLEQIVNDYAQGTMFDASFEESFNRSVISVLENLRITFIVVDFQNDFVSGSLSIKDGDASEDPMDALPSLNALLTNETWDLVVYSQDWHPSSHISFFEYARSADRVLSVKDRNRKLHVFDTVRFEKPSVEQTLYPTHCVQLSWGAELHPAVEKVDGAQYIRKGTDVYVDSYSAFTDNNGAKKTALEGILHENGINAVVACGLAYDICVKYTVKDASSLGFLSAVVSDCSKGLTLAGIAQANEDFKQHNIAVVNQAQAAEISQRRAVPVEWIRVLAANSPRPNK